MNSFEMGFTSLKPFILFSLLMNLIFYVNSEKLHSFYFDLSNFVSYTFQCGKVLCTGIYQYCDAGDLQTISDDVCRYCTEDMCKYDKKLPGQCQIMCRVYGFLKDSEFVRNQTTPSTNNTGVTFHQDDFRIVAMVEASVIGVMLIGILMYIWKRTSLFTAVPEKIQTLILRCVKQPPIIAIPTDSYKVPHVVNLPPNSEIDDVQDTLLKG